MKPKSKLEASYSLLDKCISVEKDLIWMQSNCDPFAAILSSLEKKEVVCICSWICLVVLHRVVVCRREIYTKLLVHRRAHRAAQLPSFLM
ncbi:hypothetical protein OESDEN_03046 [Oesophagostomum dentatum]|uniref:Uncharacterized protein n=1 Tax=Oesophagostomum dentatum TaxID=61180 RepID=A0A0B1TLK5_OESDE|nr:hypothetical protein OESDEN_03046 [Oesophagostomum dentatum]